MSVKEREVRKSRWSSPLVLAILGATIAALGNAVVAVYNGYSAHQLEQNKADADRVLEIVKSHDPVTVSSQLITVQARLGREAFVSP